MAMRIVKWIAAGVALTIVAVSLLWARTCGPLRDPEDALADFYEARNRAEDQLRDPLILAGSDVVPLVIEAVAWRDMPLRRYAISYLGIARQPEAASVLTEILRDEAEIDYFRSDALQALYRIDRSLAASLAVRYGNREDLLGPIASRIASGTYSPGHDRTWWEAFRSVHH
jgi:hypothetical protein